MSAESLSPRLLRNYWLDVALLLGFLAVFITGELKGRWHQGLAIALCAGLAVHLAWHWPALKRLPVTLLGRSGPRSRANAAVDLPLMVILVFTLASGLIASPWLTAAPDHSWVFRHHVLPKLMLGGVVVHLALHRAWIAWATGRIPGRYAKR
jgi:hypothetical protein